MASKVEAMPRMIDLSSSASIIHDWNLLEHDRDSSGVATLRTCGDDGAGELAIDDHVSDLDFHHLPPFPSNVPVAPLLRISLQKLLSGEQNEVDRLWKACRELGFFYLDLRGGRSGAPQGVPSSEREELIANVWRGSGATGKTNTEVNAAKDSQLEEEQDIDGDQLVKDANDLFDVGEEVFRLPVEEKIKYDFKDQGSYYGYKGYGEGVIDSKGTKDRNEFYNVSKDDILGISNPLPAPAILVPQRDLLASYMRHSHAIVTLLLRLLNARLDLPPEKLPSLHRLLVASGNQVRWVHAPPQPQHDRTTALGEHTDFGSVTILFNRLGGLQVLLPHTDEWCYVKPLRGHAVVNLGDALVKFTAGVLRSNIHRVVNPPGEQAESTRMSLVYFARPEDDVLLKVLDGSKCVDAHRKEMVKFAGEEEISSKEWIKRRALGRRRGGDWQKSGGTEERRTA
ncbi:hypothetical protein BDV97DRAFT_344114 [Delphinella strobiligena]|nr:hypothetical protein BDV97DRAFT_344114 [Delphinella strobiligena]